MSSSSSNLIAFLAVFVFTINAATALKCYQCDSSKGVSCNYGLLSFTYSSVDCEVKSGSGILDTIVSIIPTNCVKLVGRDRDGNDYVARSCAPSTGPVNTCNAIAKLVQFAETKDLESLDCYTCDNDNCNSASKAGVTLMGLVAACFLFLF